jgi:alpha-beta hydrolase superfamily lysophospholipase
MATTPASGTTSGSSGSSSLPTFYSVPSDVASLPPGTLLKDQEVATTGLDGSSYRVMYVSQNEQGQSVAVTGLVFVPPVAPPVGGYPVLDWAHPTDGMAEVCAPSLNPATAMPSLAGLDILLAQGWEVVESDYQGEGTSPGVLPYMVGDVSAYDTIDIVLAARQLAAADAGSKYVVLGYSEGGQAAMFAWELGPTYGDRGGIHMVAVVAGAPPSNLVAAVPHLVGGPYQYLAYMLAAGYYVGYGNSQAPLSQVLTSTGVSLASVVTYGCGAYVAGVLGKYSATQLFKSPPFSTPKWQSLLSANDPAHITSTNSIPLLLVQGGADTLVSPSNTEAVAAHLCQAGQQLELWLYPGATHVSILTVSATDVVRWLGDALDGANPASYVPSGETGVESTACT